jgi:hypothetical protein
LQDANEEVEVSHIPKETMVATPSIPPSFLSNDPPPTIPFHLFPSDQFLTNQIRIMTLTLFLTNKIVDIQKK